MKVEDWAKTWGRAFLFCPEHATTLVLVIITLLATTTCERQIWINPFAPEPPVTARVDPGPFYPL